MAASPGIRSAADARRPVRVALVDSIVPPYRVPFLAALAQRPELDVTCFHGRARGDQPRAAAPGTLPVRSREIVNVFSPRGAPRIVWQRGVVGALGRRYDAVVIGEGVHNLSSWIVWILARIAGRRRIVNGQFHLRPDGAGGRAAGWKERARRRLQTFILRGADAVLAYTEDGRRRCEADGCDPAAVFVTGNTLDVARIADLAAAVGAARRDETRAALAAGDGPVAIYLGRLYAAKRVDLLIGAVERLQQKGHAATAVIVGDGPERDALEKRAGGAPFVRFLGAIYDPADLAPVLAAADVLVVPGILGLAVVHGFASGLPAVTCAGLTRHGPEAGYLRDGENGILAAVPTADAVAEAILRVTVEPGRHAALRDAARRTAADLPMSSMVDSFVAAALHATGRSPAPSSHGGDRA